MALHTAVVVAFSGEKPEFHSADDPPIATWNWFYYSSVALTHSCMMAMITLLRVWVSPRRRLTGAIVKVSLYLCVPLLFIAEMLVCGVGWERWGFANLGPTPDYCEALIRHEIPWEYVYKPYVAMDNSTAASGDSSGDVDVGSGDADGGRRLEGPLEPSAGSYLWQYVEMGSVFEVVAAVYLIYSIGLILSWVGIAANFRCLRSFIGGTRNTSTTLRTRLVYTLLWLVILGLKFAFEYYMLCFSIGSRPKPHSSHPKSPYTGTTCSSCRCCRCHG